MLRLGGRLIAVAMLCLWVFVPFLDLEAVDTDFVSEPTTITKYDADFTVADDGDLRAVETITVNFPQFESRHGIFRFFDVRDPNEPTARRIPRDVSVSMDGSSEDYEELTEKRGRYRTLKIGEACCTVSSGEHTYVIRYTIDGVLAKGSEQPTQFYWNLIPGGWRQHIDRAQLRVHLPVDAQDVQCAVGVGSTSGCTAEGAGSRDLTVDVSDLGANTPVTLKTQLDMKQPPVGNQHLWPQPFDSVLGTSLTGLLVVLGIAVLAGLLGWRAAASAKEETPPFPLMYAPPEGIGPAQGAYLLDEKVARNGFVASLMEAGEKGVAKLQLEDKGWTLEAQRKADDSLDEVTRGILSVLGISGGNGGFSASRTNVGAGKKLKSALDSYKSDTKNWASSRGLIKPSGLGAAGGTLVVIAAIAAFVIPLANKVIPLSVLALIPGLFAIFAAGLLRPGTSTVRTPAARDLWSRTGGFRRILATPSAVERFDFSGRKELYTAYLPWAVAFGCAGVWADKYRIEVGEEPPMPAYVYGGSNTPLSSWNTGDVVSHIVTDFNSTLDSAISSYEATQRASSSGGGGSSFSGGGGGGGFSGGGGGGGGGGGSW